MPNKSSGKKGTGAVVGTHSKRGLQLDSLQDVVQESVQKLGQGWSVRSTTVHDMEVVAGSGPKDMLFVATLAIKLRKK